MNIKNELENKEIEVLVEFGEKGRRRPDDTSPIGSNDRGTIIGFKESQYVEFDDDDDHENDFKLIIKIDRLPQRDGDENEGIKFYPGYGRRIGNNVFSFHHFEYQNIGNSIEIIAHYDLISIDDTTIQKTHIDPEIHHPTPPRPIIEDD